MEEVPRCTSLAPLAFPWFVLCYKKGVETEGLLDYQGRAGIISIVRWNLRPVILILGVELLGVCEKSILASPGKEGKKNPKQENGSKTAFGPFFLFLVDFFPIFGARPKSIFVGDFFFLSDFGLEALSGTHTRKLNLRNSRKPSETPKNLLAHKRPRKITTPRKRRSGIMWQIGVLI